MTKVIGSIALTNGFTFHYINANEVYGVVIEDNTGEVLVDSAGYYRCDNPELAAKIACNNTSYLRVK